MPGDARVFFFRSASTRGFFLLAMQPLGWRTPAHMSEKKMLTKGCGLGILSDAFFYGRTFGSVLWLVDADMCIDMCVDVCRHVRRRV